MKISAINNYCVLDVILPSTEVKKGAIIMPNTTQVTPRWAKVTSIGPGVYDAHGTLRKPDVLIGDTVYAMAHGQFAIHKSSTHETGTLAVTSALDILVILKDMNTLQIQPLGSYIEIEKVELDIQNESGIEMPDVRKAPTNVGIVKSVGIGWTGPYGDPIPMQVKVGDKVVYSPLRTMVVDFISLGLDEKKYLIQHGDIIGILESE